MKKLFSMALALVLCLSLSLTAFATEVNDDTQTGQNTEDGNGTIEEDNGGETSEENGDGTTPGGNGGDTTTGENGGDTTIEGGSGSSKMATITITPKKDDKGSVYDNHVYDVYQIFKGDVSEKDGEIYLSNVKRGKNYGPENEPLTKEELERIINKDTNPEEFAKGLVEAGNLGTAFATLEKKNDFSAEVPTGYYLIVDRTSGDPVGENPDAYSAYIVQVVGDLKMEPKSNVPTVDKKVSDDEVNGWYETADHDINESFQFKLTATVPADSNLASYDSYKLVFHDTMSKGITYEGIASVKVNDEEIDESQYVVFGINPNESGLKEWTVTINDLKAIPDVTLTEGVVVEVIYNAHLNAEAHTTISTEENVVEGADVNTNKVYLEYSNEPYANGTGQTKDDTVYVFTFRLDNTKVKDDVDGAALEGAGFTLWKDGKKVRFYRDNDKYCVAPADMPDKDTVTEIESDKDGKFSFYGLDAGTYTLEETKVPATYNKCKDITITIDATHVRNDDNSATVTLTQESNLTNTIVNESGTILPSTGGIGTTIFYVVGGILIVSAVILLIGKKRMDKKVK